MKRTSDLPSNWTWARISEFTESIGGGTPPKSDLIYWTNGEIPWVSPKDMKSFMLVATEDKITCQALERLTLIPPNSVLVVVRSGILSRTLPVGLNTMPVAINQDMRAFVPKQRINSFFLAWQLVAREQEILAACSKHGTTVASIEGPSLASFPLSIAPAEEQVRIVRKLEELLSDLDAGVAELKAAQKKIEKYRQSLLKAAVDGTLTASWREAQRQAEGEPMEIGAQLLERILAERRAQWEIKQLAKFEEQGKQPPVRWQHKYNLPLGANGDAQAPLPSNWVWATVDQLAQVGTGVTPLRSKKGYFEGGNVPWITSGAVNKEIIEQAKEFVTELALKECRLTVFPSGSLVVAMYGEGRTRGKTSELGIPATINQALAALVLEPAALPCKAFVKSFLLHNYERLREQASGGVQPNLNLQIVKSIAMPLPPLDEQAEIAWVLALQIDQLERQKSAIALSLKQAAAQRQNILKAAFSGRLVPQDPNDEPAAVLLERIRAERATRSATAVPRQRRAKSTA